MSGRPTQNYPDDDALVALVEEHGSVMAVAAVLDINPATLTSYVRTRALNERCAAARQGFAQRQKAQEAQEVGDDGQREVSEVEALRQEVSELRSAARRRREGDVFEHRILSRIEDGIVAAKPRYSPRATRSGKRLDGHEFALLFSDTHAGEVVEPEATLGMNDYRWEVMLGRMERLQRSVLSYQENRPYPIETLRVWMLGDMLSGDIHDELMTTNEFTAEQAAVQFGLDSARWLEGFVPHFRRISVVGVPGNHPRRTRKPSAKQAFNNSDWTAYQVAKTYLRGYDCFEWELPLAAYAVTTVAQRWRVLLMHGDGIRSSMPGVPWGGVVRRLTALEQQFSKAKQPLDYVALGHFHTANYLDGVGVKAFMNGSVKGLDEYSLKAFGSGRPPSQLLLTFHPRKGITDVSTIDLVDMVPAGEGHAA